MRKINDNCHPGPAMCPFWAHICVEPNLLNSAQVKMGASTLCTADHCTGYDWQLLQFLGHVRSCVYIYIFNFRYIVFFKHKPMISAFWENTKLSRAFFFILRMYCFTTSTAVGWQLVILHASCCSFFFFSWITYLRIRSEGHFYIIGNGSLVNSD